MSISTVSEEICRFIHSEVENMEIDSIGSDTSLLESGILDSFSMVNLLSFLNGTFGIEIPDDELLPENFETPLAIARLVCRSYA
jgi:acyl carrier protein